MVRSRDGIERVEFLRTKYGRELLVDTAWIHAMPTFITDRAHRLQFYDITLVTAGSGFVTIDARRQVVQPGALVFTSPGQVRSWDVRGLDGICLFFPGAFLDDFFRDATFLQRLPYFHPDHDAVGLSLSRSGSRRVRGLLEGMRNELAAFDRQSEHLLRARLYEVLAFLAREYALKTGVPWRRAPGEVAQRYCEMVERDAARCHHVGPYARALGVSDGYLNALCRRSLGRGAKQIIQEQLLLEAQRRLLHTPDSSARVANALGFKDPSYFVRFFRRMTGRTPEGFREWARS